MIKPTVGRIVWYHADKADGAEAAIVTRVFQDTHVDLTVFHPLSEPSYYASVPLIQDGDESPRLGHFCEWMPYQKGQAAKTENLEKQIKATGAELQGDAALK